MYMFMKVGSSEKTIKFMLGIKIYLHMCTVYLTNYFTNKYSY